MRNVQITETGVNALGYINILLNIMPHVGYIRQQGQEKNDLHLHFTIEVAIFC